jgi:hypothetical protein
MSSTARLLGAIAAGIVVFFISVLILFATAARQPINSPPQTFASSDVLGWAIVIGLSIGVPVGLLRLVGKRS